MMMMMMMMHTTGITTDRKFWLNIWFKRILP